MTETNSDTSMSLVLTMTETRISNTVPFYKRGKSVWYSRSTDGQQPALHLVYASERYDNDQDSISN
jgi:hypothetical protein